MSAPPPEATGQSVAAATDELKALGIDVIEITCSGRGVARGADSARAPHARRACPPPSARAGASARARVDGSLPTKKGTGALVRDGDRARKCRGAARIEPRLGERGWRARGSRRRTRTTHGLRRGEPRGRERKRRTKKTSRRRVRAGLASSARGALAAFERAVGRRRRVRPGVRRGLARDLATLPRRFAARSSSSSSDGDGDGDDDDVEKREKAFGSRDESAADSKGVEGRLAPVCFLAQTCGRWGGYGYDAALYESSRCSASAPRRWRRWGGGDTPRRRRGAATRLRVFGGAAWRRGRAAARPRRRTRRIIPRFARGVCAPPQRLPRRRACPRTTEPPRRRSAPWNGWRRFRE